MSFTQFNRAGHRDLSTQIAAELEALGQRLGVSFSVGGGTIGASDLTIKIIAKSADPMVAETQAKKDLDTYGRYYGLVGADYGTTFSGANGGMYKLTGVSPSRPKYPIDAVCVRTGRAFKHTQSVVAKIVARRPSAASTTPTPGTNSGAPSSVGSSNPYADLAQF